MQHRNFHGLDVSVNAMNDALYAQGFFMPVHEQEAVLVAGAHNTELTTCLVTLSCPMCSRVEGLEFFAYPKGHGNQKGLVKEHKNKNDRTMRTMQKHFQTCHPDRARQPRANPSGRKRVAPADDLPVTEDVQMDAEVPLTLAPAAKRMRTDLDVTYDAPRVDRAVLHTAAVPAIVPTGRAAGDVQQQQLVPDQDAALQQAYTRHVNHLRSHAALLDNSLRTYAILPNSPTCRTRLFAHCTCLHRLLFALAFLLQHHRAIILSWVVGIEISSASTMTRP
jgi:hypothetical protein